MGKFPENLNTDWCLLEVGPTEIACENICKNLCLWPFETKYELLCFLDSNMSQFLVCLHISMGNKVCSNEIKTHISFSYN